MPIKQVAETPRAVDIPPDSKMENLIGRTFDWVHVAWFGGWHRGGMRWVVVCRCGFVHFAFGSNLKRGRHLSCGCKNRKHAHNTRDPSNQRLYSIWNHMRARCYNPKCPVFKNYGGRDDGAITMCQRFLASFNSFCELVMPRPSLNHTMDRINVNAGYWCGCCAECSRNGWPRNWRWATWDVQQNNRRNTVRLTFRGESLPISDWVKRTGLGRSTIKNRLRTGMSVEEALTTPLRRKGSYKGGVFIEFRGRRDYLANWAREFGINQTTLANRIRRGWSVEDALCTPTDEYHKCRSRGLVVLNVHGEVAP